MQITLLQAVIIGLWTAFCYSGMLWGIFTNRALVLSFGVGIVCGEHVNDHQRQIIKVFSEKNYLIGIQNVEDLPEAIKESETFEPNKYKNNNQKMLNIIEDFIEKV